MDLVAVIVSVILICLTTELLELVRVAAAANCHCMVSTRMCLMYFIVTTCYCLVFVIYLSNCCHYHTSLCEIDCGMTSVVGWSLVVTKADCDLRL